MKPRNTHIVETLHPIAQRFSGKRRFLGSIHIARASGGHHDSAVACRLGHAPNQPHAWNIVVGEFISEMLGHKAYRFGLHTGDKHRFGAALL